MDAALYKVLSQPELGFLGDSNFDFCSGFQESPYVPR